MKNRMKPSVIPDSKTHPKSDSAFKQEAVNLWKSSGKSAATVAAELGIKMERLYTWRAKYVSVPTGEGAETMTREQLLADNAALLRELDHVRQQREIQTKTALCTNPGFLSSFPASIGRFCTSIDDLDGSDSATSRDRLADQTAPPSQSTIRVPGLAWNNPQHSESAQNRYCRLE